LFNEPGIKYLGYAYFLDDEMKTKSSFNYYRAKSTDLINGKHYDVLEN